MLIKLCSSSVRKSIVDICQLLVSIPVCPMLLIFATLLLINNVTNQIMIFIGTSTCSTKNLIKPAHPVAACRLVEIGRNRWTKNLNFGDVSTTYDGKPKATMLHISRNFHLFLKLGNNYKLFFFFNLAFLPFYSWLLVYSLPHTVSDQFGCLPRKIFILYLTWSSTKSIILWDKKKQIAVRSQHGILSLWIFNISPHKGNFFFPKGLQISDYQH